MSSGHSSLVRRPSSSLKEKLMVRIESHRDSMDILKKVLRIDKTQGKTVREVIAFAEERDGELFLDTWRFIFVRLSLRKDFEKLVDADHWPLTNPIKTLEGPLQDQHTRKAYDNTHERSLQENSPYRNKPEEPLLNKLKETRLNNLKVSRLETQKTRSSSKNWPDWSLPPPSEDNLSQETWKETTMEMRDDEAGERDVSSDGQNLQEFLNGDSSLSSPAPLPSQLEQFAAPGTSVTEKEEGRSLTWQIDSDHGLSSDDSQPVTTSYS